MTLLGKLKRLFNKNYKLIDTKNRIFNGKKYTPDKDKFFQIARNTQNKYGLTQQVAVDMVHDSFAVKNDYKKIADSKDDYDKVKRIEKTYQDWIDLGYYDEFYETVEYIVDEYE